MAYSARIILDSCNPHQDRLTTFEITYPRFVHAELMTHRVFSRNSSSSRAIPIEKMMKRVEEDPVEPIWFGVNQSGMQAKTEMDEKTKRQFLLQWHAARKDALTYAKAMSSPGVNAHKQIVNRILEPWMWITVVVTSTDWDNFFHLRTHPDAQPEIKHIADMMCSLYYQNNPVGLNINEWHLPYLFDKTESEISCLRSNPISIEEGIDYREISTARCARVSYLTHDGERDLSKDVDLFNRLISSGHWSPLEHIASAWHNGTPSGNLKGWRQFRKQFKGEHCTSFDFTQWQFDQEVKQDAIHS